MERCGSCGAVPEPGTRFCGDGDRLRNEALALGVAAVAELRDKGTPYHLAHGLFDYAGHLAAARAPGAAATAITEASEIAARLGCRPLLDRAASLAPAARELSR
jgi:hypothetical protein